MKINHFSSESIVASMATFVGICALIVSITQTHYQRKYLLASAWPHLQIEPHRYESSSDSAKNSITIRLMNKGIGPAIIKSVSYQYRGKDYKRIETLIVAILGKKFGYWFKMYALLLRVSQTYF